MNVDVVPAGPACRVPRWKRGRGWRGPAALPQRGAQVRLDTHLRQLAELVGVQQQLLQAAGVAVDLLGDVDQRAVALVDGLHMTVAPPQGDAVEHRRPPPGPEPRRPRLPARSARPAAALRPPPTPRLLAPVLAHTSRRAPRSQKHPGTSGESNPPPSPAPPPARRCAPPTLRPRRSRQRRAELPTRRRRRTTEHARQWARAQGGSRPRDAPLRVFVATWIRRVGVAAVRRSRSPYSGWDPGSVAASEGAPLKEPGTKRRQGRGSRGGAE